MKIHYKNKIEYFFLEVLPMLFLGMLGLINVICLPFFICFNLGRLGVFALIVWILCICGTAILSLFVSSIFWIAFGVVLAIGYVLSCIMQLAIANES